MARTLLSLLLALVLASFGSSFALAQSDDDPCAVDAGVAQVEDDEPLEDDEEWIDEDDWTEEDEFVEDEPLDDELADCDDVLLEDDLLDEGAETADETAADTRIRRGSGRADRMIGDAGVNLFYGRGGDDFLDGRGGRDMLNGGPGDDVIVTGKRKVGASRKRASKKGTEVNAGKGNDVVRARNGRVDTVHCGLGKDSVLADRGDRVRARNCETVRYG